MGRGDRAVGDRGGEAVQITLTIPKRAKRDGPAAGAVTNATPKVNPQQRNIRYDRRRDARDQQQDGRDKKQERADVVEEARHG